MNHIRSIKFRFFVIICAIAVAFVGILTVLNFFFYDDYYMFERRHALADIYRSVNTQYHGDISVLSDSLELMENNTGVRLTVFDSTGEIQYDSIFREPRPPREWFVGGEGSPLYDLMLTGSIMAETDRETLDRQGYAYVSTIHAGAAIGQDGPKREGHKQQNDFLCLVGKLGDGGDTLIARVPMAYMEQNSAFSMAFLLISSLATLLVCMALAYFVSRQFAHPLIEIEEIATAMADLDFSKQYHGRGQDEVGRLGQSINRLSEHLERAIGELKRTNEELAHEIDEKEKIDRMRREFIVNVSHELKTPIALIQGYAEGLRVGVTDSEADREYYCDIIVDEAGRMNRQVMQLLGLSKLELGRDKPEPVEIDLYSLCQEMADKTSVLAEERRLQMDYSQTHVTMYADYNMLEQVITNFLSNAIRYTPDGGRITMAAAEEPDGGTTLAVENEGEPIPEDELEMVFEKFYRTDKARTRESGGTGIGLSIVKAIADAHGGACGAQNIPGGVRFWFYIPGNKPG